MRLVHRLVLSLLSQGLNTAQNLTLALLAARYSDAAEYGAWGIVFAIFVVAQNVTRAVVSTPQLIDDPQNVRPSGAGVGASVSLSVPLALFLAGLSIILPVGELRGLILAIALLLPPTLAHDALRYTAIRHVRDRQLVGLDAWWFVVQVVISGGLIFCGEASALTLTLAWGAGAAVASCAHCVWYRVVPNLYAGRQLLVDEGRAGRLMAVETLLGSVPVNAVPAVLGATLGLSAAGHFRGAMTIIGGIGLFIAGLTPIMTMESSRRLRVDDKAGGLVGAWSAAIAVLSLAYMLVFMLIPDRIGQALLGEVWIGTSSILIMFTIAVTVRGPFTGAPIILRSRRQFGAAIRLRLTTGWVQVLCPFVGALLGGLTGAAWGYAVAALINDGQALRALSVSGRSAASAAAASRPV